MLIITVLIAGIVIGVLVMVVLNRRSADTQRLNPGSAARRLLRRSHSEETAMSRDRAEHAGGSRHIRTHPSWRDRLE
ncbi:hypothetical protein [Nocardia transvalensis]|uniref:hypothetical protein n=1 Tax=Nocardia transvalensis TaxID=37333 RepID=UPI001895923A|nr:hypothetical protein [Nocardia transvalensis]MBF6334109.1 hypothetical protein [Nocardia transvalensis]